MTKFRVLCWPLVAVLLGAAPQALAAEVKVNCAKKTQTLGRAIARLPAAGRHVITVRGTCRESVVIDGRADLTIQGGADATIEAPTAAAGATAVVQVNRSARVRLRDLAISGGASGIRCGAGSNCYLEGLRVANAGAAGIAFEHAFGWIDRTVLEGNGVGLQLSDLANVTIGPGSAIRGSKAHGIVLQGDSVLVVDAEITGNAGDGVHVEPGAELRLLGAARVASNGAHGLFVDTGVASVGPGVHITGNAQHGVHLSPAAQARFGWASVTDNRSGTDVHCAAATSITFNARDRIGGGTTNCRDAP